jgi:hypothetical protein
MPINKVDVLMEVHRESVPPPRKIWFASKENLMEACKDKGLWIIHMGLAKFSELVNNRPKGEKNYPDGCGINVDIRLNEKSYFVQEFIPTGAVRVERTLSDIQQYQKALLDTMVEKRMYFNFYVPKDDTKIRFLDPSPSWKPPASQSKGRLLRGQSKPPMIFNYLDLPNFFDGFQFVCLQQKTCDKGCPLKEEQSAIR